MICESFFPIFFSLNLQNNITENVSLLNKMDFEHGKYEFSSANAEITHTQSHSLLLGHTHNRDDYSKKRIALNFSD